MRGLLGSLKFPGQGSIFIGTKGQMLLAHTATPVLLATRFPNVRLQWNEAKAKFWGSDSGSANGFLRRKYREGWSGCGAWLNLEC